MSNAAVTQQTNGIYILRETGRHKNIVNKTSNKAWHKVVFVIITASSKMKILIKIVSDNLEVALNNSLIFISGHIASVDICCFVTTNLKSLLCC